MSEFGQAQRDTYERYDLSDELTERLITDFLDSKDIPYDERFVCFRVPGDSPIADVGRNLERQVFEEAFSGNDAEFMRREYGPYESASTFFISLDCENKTPSGVLRVISNSEAGFKTLNDLATPGSPVLLTQEQVQQFHHIEDFDRCWDIGTVAIPKELRRSGANISTQLYRGMYKTALERHIDHFVAIIDEGPLIAMTEYLSIPFVPLCDTTAFSYLGSSVSQAVYGHVTEFDGIIDRKLATIHGDGPYETGLRRALMKVFKGSEDHSVYFDDSY